MLFCSQKDVTFLFTAFDYPPADAGSNSHPPSLSLGLSPLVSSLSLPIGAASSQVACMQFINIVVHSVEDMNFRVHLQYEFTKLGLEEFLQVSLAASSEGEELWGKGPAEPYHKGFWGVFLQEPSHGCSCYTLPVCCGMGLRPALRGRPNQTAPWGENLAYPQQEFPGS